MTSWNEVKTYIENLLKPGLTNNTSVQKLLNSFQAIINLLNSGSMDPENDAEWKPGVTYAKDVSPVLWRDTWLVSNITDNVGIQPINDQGTVHPAWRVVNSSIGSGIRIWSPLVYPNVLEMVFYNDALYYLDRAVVGSGPFISSDFVAEFVALKWAMLTGGEAALTPAQLVALLSSIEVEADKLPIQAVKGANLTIDPLQFDFDENDPADYLKIALDAVPVFNSKKFLDSGALFAYEAANPKYSQLQVDSLVAAGIRKIIPSSPDDGIEGIKFPTESGTYTNYGGIVIDINEGLNLIYKDLIGATFTKVLIPIDLSGYATQDDIENMVEFTQGKNLFNKETTIDGSYRTTINVLIVNEDYFTSADIPVVAGLSYAVSGSLLSPAALRLLWYDSLGVFISGTQDVGVMVAPANAAFLTISTGIVNKDTMQVEQAASATGYEAFQKTISLYIQIKDEQIKGARLKSEKIANLDLNLILPSKNLFDKSTANIGFYRSHETNILIAHADYFESAHIPVVAGLSYAISGNLLSPASRRIIWYNSSGQYISGTIGELNPLVAPANATSLRFSTGLTNIDTMQFELASSPTSYAPFGGKVDPDFLPAINDQVSFRFTSFGDSLVSQARWQPKIAARLRQGLNIIRSEKGIGGTRISGAGETAFWQDVRVNDILADSVVVYLMGGTNDWVQNAPIGTVASVDTTTVMGALNVCITKILTRCPECYLVISTPPYSEMLDFAGRGWANSRTNTLSLTISDYADAIREVAQKRNIQVIDLNKTLSWNEVNLTSFQENDGNLIHPNTTIGSQRIANVVADFLNGII